ncbi:MAG: EAL domain-containing protein, partial [Acidimicrobiia bacterium]|nr:EAL domain-containing protein [Acidimicrobiia bacterium]
IADQVVRLWYQPIRDLSSKAKIGAEALFRVDVAGERVVLTPDLLGVLGPRIARHVLTVLVEDAVGMYDAGTLPPYIGVNLTAPDLLSDDIHEQVLAAHATLQELGCSLAVEISEQVGLHDLTGVRPAIESIRGEGIQVALDDFGTGSNSLALLRELPLDALKLDPSFVSGAMGHAADRAIVKAAVALADELDLALIAEGVETEGILAFIRGAGIRFAQGYLFDRPPPSTNGDD